METTASHKNGLGTSRLRGMSIQQRLQLLLCFLLVAIVLTFCLVSYLAIRKSAITDGTKRITTISSELSNMFTQSTQGMMLQSLTSANHPVVKTFINSDTSRRASQLDPLIEKIKEDSTTMGLEILDPRWNPLFKWGFDSLNFGNRYGTMIQISANRPDSTMIGRIFRVRDSMYFPVLVPVTEEKRVIGYLVRWRVMRVTPEAVEQFSGLIGGKASIFIGNADGSLWTDMMKPINSSSDQNKSEAGVITAYTGFKGEEVFGITQPIVGSPWIVRVESPQSDIVASANNFLKRMLLLGGLIVLIGIAVAWVMSRSITKPLEKLTKATASIADGNYSVEVPVERRDEIGKLARAFKEMSRQVAHGKKDLEQKIAETEEMNTQLRNLSAHLQNIREEERIHIAREMHDELGQLLTGFKMDAAWLQKKIDASGNTAHLHERMTSMLAGIDEAVKFVRKLAAELRPSMLDDLGLVPALEWHSQEFQKRYNIPVNFHSTINSIEIPPLQATGLFRMYQESLTNIARHAHATMVVASLGIKNDQLCLSVVDDGKGFLVESDQRRQTLGLLGMKERAMMIGGNLDISSSPGKGTRVFITVPLRQVVI